MDDIFYLSQKKLDVAYLYRIFQNVNELRADIFEISNAVQLQTKTQIINLALMGISEFKDSLCWELIRIREISSVVCISHHKAYIKETLDIVKILLTKCGGWIGNDNDGFLPIFDLTDIESFSYCIKSHPNK